MFLQAAQFIKLKVNIQRFSGRTSNVINDLGKVIGANLNLAHLELANYTGFEGYLSTIFGYVPTSSPLKLEQLGISYGFANAMAIVPHIHFLTSIHWGDILSTVPHSERIFPPIITTTSVDSHLIDYLSQHPRIVSLSIHANLWEGRY